MAEPPSGAAGLPRTFEAVQILRGVAASLVVFHHFCYVIAEYHPQRSMLASWRDLAETGAAGVDIFFCISGLVIAHSARNFPRGASSALSFLQRRVLRVVPLYWLFSAILFAAWASGKAFTSLIMTPQLAIASLLLIPYPKRTVSGEESLHPLLDVGWTLTFELYFYAACAAVVWLAGGRRIFPWVLLALHAAAALSLMTTGFASRLSYVLASPLMAEFAAGVVLARFAEPLLAQNRAWSHRLGPTLIIAGALALAASALHNMPVEWRVLYWGVPGILLTAGAMMVRVDTGRATLRGLLFLGTASYTIYLAHPLVTLAMGTLLKRGWLHTIQPDITLVALTVATIVAAAATYPMLEGPLLRWSKRANIPMTGSAGSFVPTQATAVR